MTLAVGWAALFYERNVLDRRRERPPASGVQRYQMREQLLSIGDDYWIEHESGERAFKVDGKAVRLRKTLVLQDASGADVAKIQERLLRMRDSMKMERPAGTRRAPSATPGHPTFKPGSYIRRSPIPAKDSLRSKSSRPHELSPVNLPVNGRA